MRRILKIAGRKLSTKVKSGIFAPPPWREAATVLLASCHCQEQAKGKGDRLRPEFLFLTRSKESKFLPGGLCYPGGTISSEDGSVVWSKYLEAVSRTNVNEISYFKHLNKFPQIYMDTSNVENEKHEIAMPKDVKLRITAIREVFEETGILLGEKTGDWFIQYGINHVKEHADVIPVDPHEIKLWQEKVRENPAFFRDLCRKYNCLPDINALVEWSNWLTPTFNPPHKRFDTMTYIALLPETPEVHVDGHEMTDSHWITAREAMKGYLDGTYFMLPPQIYEMSSLKDCSVKKLEQLVRIRLNLGITRLLGVFMKANDGGLFVLPGDDLYPAIVNDRGKQEPKQIDMSIEDLRNTTENHHRLEFTEVERFNLVRNIKPSDGYIF